VYPAVIGGRLQGDRIALVALGGLDQGTANSVEAALGPAGARIAEVAVVREPPDLDALASTVDGEAARGVARGDAEELRRLGERSGRALVSGSGSFDELRGTLLSRYSGRAGAIDAVVVVRDHPDGLEPDEEAANAELETGLVAGLADAATTVGVERSDSESSSIVFYDGHGLPSVDSVDLVSGRVATVYALGGEVNGNFGVKDTADSLLPDLLPPGRGGTNPGSGEQPGSARD
jgi:hypothetical protein